MKLLFCCVLLTLLPAAAKADTLTIIYNLSINGAVTYQEDKFTIEAKFKKDKTEKLEFSRSEVKSVEINSTTVNQGPPPPWINKYKVDSAVKEKNKNYSIDLSRRSGPTPNPPVLAPADPNNVPGFPREHVAIDDPPPHIAEPIGESTAGRTGGPNMGTQSGALPDEVRLNDKVKQKGRLTLINRDAVKLTAGGKDLLFNRSVVHSIIVGH